jgi:hypothetical protein
MIKALTSELLAIDRFSAGTVSFSEVAALKHEAGDNTMESRAFVAKTVLARRKLTEVFGGFWDDVVVQLEYDTTGGGIVNAYIELRT